MSLMKPLTKEQEDIILEEVGYKREQLDQDVKQLRQWLEDQQHLPPSRLKEKDCFLKTYLLGCKGSIETAKKKLDAYYTFRRHTDLFDKRDPLHEDYMVKNKSCYTILLPQLSKSTELVMGNITIDSDTKNYNYLYHMRRIINILELKMRMADVISSSICFLIDMKAFTPGHIALFNPIIVRDMLCLIQNILPFRVKAFIFVNAPKFMEIALNNLIKPFLSQKLKERFHIFSNGQEEFYKFADKNIFPKELGGDEEKTLKEIHDYWSKKEAEERVWFLNELSELTDESKRIKTDNIIDDTYFGVHGTLKKLVLD